MSARRNLKPSPALAAALAATALVALGDGPRTALLAALAAGALAATRVRFCGRAALGVLALAALLALGGWGPAFDQRPGPTPASGAKHGSQKERGEVGRGQR